MKTLPRCTGTYALVLRAKSSVSVTIGRFGVLAVRPGYYVYVGSAFGPGGLKARLAHHARPAKHPHWHIDYLRAALPLREIWYACGRTRRESQWARVFADWPEAAVPLAGFGASDQRGATPIGTRRGPRAKDGAVAVSHLFHFDRAPSIEQFTRALERRVPDHESVERRVMRRAAGARIHALSRHYHVADGIESMTAASPPHSPRLRPGVEARAAGHDCMDAGGTTTGMREAELRRERQPRATQGAVAEGCPACGFPAGHKKPGRSRVR